MGKRKHRKRPPDHTSHHMRPRSRGGHFDYDPATTPEKAKEFGVQHFDTIETDGLTKDWTKFKRIWINPPFTQKHIFLEKAWQTYLVARNEIYILFPIEFMTTARFRNSCGGGKIYIPNGRIAFQSGLGKKSSSPAFGSVVMKLQDTWEVEMIDKVCGSIPQGA